MAYTRKDLATEINDEIEIKLSAGMTIVDSWLVQAILSKHDETDLSDFSKCARLEFVKDEVGRCVRRFKEPEPDELDQLTLPGFRRLQKAYKIEREEQQLIVPIELMSDAELEAKALEHDNMAKGHNVHAREIRRYIKARQKHRTMRRA